MASFQPYAGVYSATGDRVRWSCYATCRVFEVRSLERAPLPEPVAGRKWVKRAQDDRAGPAIALLVEDATAEFSHMLTRLQPLQDRQAA